MPPDGFRTPLTLHGTHVDLLPLDAAQAVELRHAARDPEVRRFLRDGPGSTLAETEALIGLLLERKTRGDDLPFAVRLKPEGPFIGMTRYLNIDRRNSGVEIGGTWYDSTYWRTGVNTECKWLLLRHAFEEEGVRRVQLQTDARNERSQRAIERIGGVREAALRENVLLADGYFRTSIIYSILASEWPTVRTRLEAMLARPWSPPGRDAGTAAGSRS
jgi:N-acetyltransferase